MEWVQSSQCDTGACVQVAQYPQTKYVAIRNSDDPRTGIAFSPEEWAAFVAGVKRGEFDFNE